MLPEQPTDPVTSDPSDSVTNNTSDAVTSNPSDAVVDDQPDAVISELSNPVANEPSNPVTSDPFKPAASKKIIRISEFRLLLLLAAFVIIATSVLGGVGVAMDYQNHMHASATATVGEATFQVMNNATYTAAVATSQAMVGPTATALVGATTQANPYPSYLAGNGTLVSVDPLSQPDNNWINSSNSSIGGAAQFTQGAYHVRESQQNRVYFAEYDTNNFSNFAFEVEMTVARGDCGGIMFRYTSIAGGYIFGVCQDGSYVLSQASSKNIQILKRGTSTAIHAGYNQSNVIAVVANGSSIDLYVNSQQIDSANDATYSYGSLALCAANDSSLTEVVYSNARLWTL